MRIEIDAFLSVKSNGYTGKVIFLDGAKNRYTYPASQFHSCKDSRRAAISETIEELEKAIQTAKERFGVIGNEHIGCTE